MKVSDILKAKGARPASVKPNDTIATLCAFLRDHRIGAAVVSSDGVGIEGIITERDVTYALAEHKSALHAMPVSALMTKTVITCSPNDDPGRVASSMLSRRFRHIPVSDGGRLVGMVSIRDVLKERVDELQQRAAHLRQLAAQMDATPQDR
jgi:CBS domain-containing protein